MCVGKVLLSRSLFICFLFFDHFHNREMQDLKLCMGTEQIRCSAGTNPCHQCSSADTPQLDVCTNISAEHSCEKAALHCLATNNDVCPGMASQCRSQSQVPVHPLEPLLSLFTSVILVRPLMIFEPKIHGI